MASYLQDSRSRNSRVDDVRTQFKTREGIYKLMRLSEYSKPSRFSTNAANSTAFRVSFATVSDAYNSRLDDVICFNIGRELYVYYYNGIRKAADLTRPLEKKTYKAPGPSPTCHDFNSFTATTDRLLLLVGFTHGQILLTEVMMKEYSKFYNEQRHTDTTKVTCIRWIPQSPSQFLAAHTSGSLYLYDDLVPVNTVPPSYQPILQGEGFAVHAGYTRTPRNPIQRWTFEGGGAVHEFAFSPCGRFLAVACATGHLRIFNFKLMEPVGIMRSYFGGLRCVTWSPDGLYIATGGEDDHITVWSTAERRVVCRGAGHKSWVNGIAFDPYTSTVPDNTNAIADLAIGETATSYEHDASVSQTVDGAVCKRLPTDISVTSYRLGSVSDDTFLCLWDLTEDVICHCMSHNRTSIIATSFLPPYDVLLSNGTVLGNGSAGKSGAPPASSANLSLKFGSLSISEQHHLKDSASNVNKRPFSTLGRSADARQHHKIGTPISDAVTPLGSPSCPRLDQVPLLEPLVCKKIAHEQVTGIFFREDCMVTACQDSIVSTWVRPGVLLTTGYL